MKRLRNFIHYSLVSQPLSIFRINQSEKSRPEPGTGHLCGPHSEVIFKPNKFDLNKQRRNENEKIQTTLPFGETGSGGFGLPTAVSVPAGQTLVIETLSLQLDVTPAGSQLEAFVNYPSGGKSVTVLVPLTFAYTQPSNGFDTYSATQAVRL